MVVLFSYSTLLSIYNKELTLCKFLKLSDNLSSVEFGTLKKIVEDENENDVLHVIETSEIKAICVCVDCNDDKYICPVPNNLYY